ncbi:prolyl oligopeptidase family serine peptidase [Fimbriimonas ginsengisoli]|uniref:Phospholipase/carboxylesterase n=1 Tax=Fimbriimonas ginsengisoli Gsoil 348 TaxID=661478 RepID=A0A068NQ32_FIMGI|nr:prolyl oligopeptidase family serine peptidase [Fimbriimonas ginsengisoli]AIE85477.1 phospholipase/carboxylesterase [Fimbriimonas ginsengisoli Gsoil 348]
MVSVLVAAAALSSAQRLPQGGVVWRLRVAHHIRVGFLVDLPEGYERDPKQKWPFILFLHGSGERGDNLSKVRVHGPPKEVANGRKLPFIVVSPQCPDGQIWDTEVLSGLVNELEKRYRIDKTREYLTGLSMGGFGVWELAAAMPDRFAAIAPICGGGSWIKCWMLAKTPIWAVHGDSDPSVPYDETRRMVENVRKLGNPEVRFDLIPGGGHDVWSAVYAGDEIYDWFLKHKRQ